jgi:glutamate 5-kinase
VGEITSDIENMVGGAGTSLGTGGMITKIKAAKIVTEQGIDMVIANGENPHILYDIVAGKDVGTRFLGKAD